MKSEREQVEVGSMNRAMIFYGIAIAAAGLL
jgi:hypothetical protein